MKKNAAVYFIVLFFLLTAAVFIVNLTAPRHLFQELAAEQITIDIENGMGFNEVANKLKSLNLIRSEFAFKIYALITGKADKIQSGVYSLKSSISAFELLNILINGPKEVSVIVFPGMTLKEIDDRLAEAGIIEKNELIDYDFKIKSDNSDFNDLKIRYPYLDGAESLEGYLLPDTYLFYQNAGADIVIRKILDNFNNKVLPFLASRDNIPEVLTLASFLEKEIPNDNERQIAAGIFQKRLRAGMPLQIDTTIIYAKCSGRFLGCDHLLREDFKIDSPYNTYLYKGLTPTPISNPSVSAIKAVLENKKSPYWYYLSDQTTKRTIFSENFDEHNRNREKYLNN